MREGPIEPPTSLPALRLLERHSPQEIADAIEIMMDFLDVLGGDVEAEPGTWTEATGPRDHDAGLTDDHEQAGDERDAPWTEFPARGRHKHTAGGTEPFDPNEDDEDDDPDQCLAQEDIGTDHPATAKMGFVGDDGWHDPEGDFCLAGDDRVTSGPVGGLPARGDEPGCEDDAEHDLMTNNVPMPPVHALEPNIFNGKREYLGHANLMTSFRSNGSSVHSADSGKRHRRVTLRRCWRLCHALAGRPRRRGLVARRRRSVDGGESNMGGD